MRSPRQPITRARRQVTVSKGLPAFGGVRFGEGQGPSPFRPCREFAHARLHALYAAFARTLIASHGALTPLPPIEARRPVDGRWADR